MRKYLFLTVMIMCLTVNAQDVVVSDTVARVEDAKCVVITEVDGGVKVEVKGAGVDKDYVYSYKHETKSNSKITVSQDWKLKLPFSSSDTVSIEGNGEVKRNKWAVVTSGFYFGFNNTIDETINERTTSSFEIGWDKVLGLQYKPWKKGPSFTLGVGIGWKIYGYDNTNLCFDGSREQIYIANYKENEIPKSSDLEVFSFRIPLTIEQKLGSSISINASAIMNVNAEAWVKKEYYIDYVKIEESFRGVPVRKVTFDVMGAINWKCLGVYVKYSPQTLFEKGKGPQFKTLSLGLGLFL